ncbi:MAG: hypothetical protein KAZ71_07445, partial [Bacteroidia bacterium]|nr:hypothetical protein [Bacteroidia bacterium]
MENNFLHNSLSNSFFNSAYQATNKCFKQAAITGVSNQSDVLKNTSVLSKSQLMKYPTSTIQQAQNLTGYSICTASNNNNLQMKNTKFTSFVFALLTTLLLFTGKSAMASPGNNIFIDASFPGAIPTANKMQFCQPDTFRMQVTNLTSNTLTDAHLYFNPFSRNPISGIIDSTTAYATYIGNNAGYSATIQANGAVLLDLSSFAPNETRTIEIYAYLNCPGYQRVNDENVLRNFYKIDYVAPGGFNWDQVNTQDYFPGIPKILITNVTPATQNVTFGTTFTRDITVVNGGFGALKEFVVNDYHGTAIVIDSIRVGDGTIVTNSATHLQVLLDSAYLAANFGPGLFGTNDALTIREYVRVVNCNTTQGASRINAAFGCNYEGAAYCDSSSNFNANAVFGTVLPLLAVSGRSTKAGCISLPADQPTTFVIKNLGDATAVNFEFASYVSDYAGGYPYGTFPRYKQSVIDTNTVMVRYNNNTPYHPVFTNIDTGRVANAPYESEFQTCFPNKSQRIQGFKILIPFILPGDSVIVSLALDNCCYTQEEQPGCNGGSVQHLGSLAYSGKYTDPCALQSADIPYAYSNSFPGPGNIDDDVRHSTWRTETPAQVFGGVADSVNFIQTGNTMQVNSTVNGAIWDSTIAGMYEVRLKVQKGLVWDGVMPTWLPNTPGSWCDTLRWKADSVYIDSTASEIQYKFFWKLPPPKLWWYDCLGSNSFLSAGRSFWFKFIPNCAYGSGNKSIKRNDYWYTGDNANIPGCESCGPIPMNCYQTTGTVLKCPGDTCYGIYNYYAKAERANYGVYDFDNNNVIDTTLSAKGQPGVKNKFVQYNDTIDMMSVGIVGIPLPGANPFNKGYIRVTNLSIDGRYFEPAEGGFVEITSVANSTTYTCSLVNLAMNTAKNNYYYEFTPAKLAANGCSIPANYIFGQGDSITVHPYIRVSANPGNSLQEVRFESELYLSNTDLPYPVGGGVPANCAGNTDINCVGAWYCDNNLSNLTLVGYSWGGTGNPSSNILGCDLVSPYTQSLFDIGGDYNQKPFANEIRNI